MGYGAPEPVQGEVAWERLIHWLAVALHPAKISLFITVQVPVRRVRARVHARDKTARLINADEKEGAVHTGMFYPCRVMIWRPEPGEGLVDHLDAPGC
jgi:hypothetical protein